MNNFVFDVQTFATTYTTQTYTTATPTPETPTDTEPTNTETTLPFVVVEDIVDKKGLNSYARKVTAFYDKRYLRTASVKYITDDDINEIITGLEDSDTVVAGGDNDTVTTADGDDTVSPDNP